MLPVLLVWCLGVLALPVAAAIPYASRVDTAPTPAVAAMLIPSGTRVNNEVGMATDERVPRRIFAASPGAVASTGDPAALPAAVDGAPVDTAAVEAEAEAALSGAPGAADGATGIPVTVLAAYRKSEAILAGAKPSCHLTWWLVASIGRIETGHAFGGRVDANGNTRGRIMGPVLDGSMPSTEVIHDSDGGKWDGDPVWDRGVGPMGFLPGSWVYWGKDGNGDGVADPHNVFDAATAAGYLLCSAGDLSDPATLGRAVLQYNHSAAYVKTVLTWAAAYRDGATPIADSSGTVPAAPRPPTTSSTSTTSAPPPSTTTAPPKPSTSTTRPPTSTTTTATTPTTTTTTTTSSTTSSSTTTAPPPAPSSTSEPTSTTTSG
ncbi:MAG: hypothetical protein ABJA74_12985 [Lapillicoccus sp.]